MSQSIAQRVKHLIAASHGRGSGRTDEGGAEAALQAIVQDIDRAIADVREELGSVIALRHRTGRIIVMNRNRIEALAEAITDAVAQERDDLAATAIARQLDLEAQIPVLLDTQSEAAARQAELDGYLAALNGRRREIEQEVQTHEVAPPAGLSAAITRLNEIEVMMRSTEVASRLAAHKSLKLAG